MVIEEVKFGSFSGGASKNIKKTSKTGIKAKLSTTVHQLLVHSGGLTPSHHKPLRREVEVTSKLSFLV